jgi:hypothetical protein
MLLALMESVSEHSKLLVHVSIAYSIYMSMSMYNIVIYY